MKTSQVLLLAVAVMLGLVVLGGGCIFQGYNHVIQIDEQANQAWAEVDNQLQRRNDLIPSLVETVKGVAGQEQAVFLGIAEARKAYFQAQTIPEKQAAGNQIETALSRLLFLQEKYPELKSNESFLKLQDSLEGTENRLTVARNRYNEAVQVLNAFVRQLPGSVFASLAGVQKRTYFEVPAEAKKNPKVDFSDLRKPHVEPAKAEQPKSRADAETSDAPQ